MVNITNAIATTMIDSIQDLYNIRNDLFGNYSLTKNLDFNDVNSYDETIPNGYSNVSDFKTAMTSNSGWIPIGDENNLFKGTLNGNSYKISNLYINTDNTGLYRNIGLFGSAGDMSILTNICLENIYINAIDDDGYSAVAIGGLVGENYNTISNSYVTGTIVTTEKGFFVGGLVGYNEQGTISNSYSNVDVTGGDWGIGGLVGHNEQGTISNSYARGNVSGTDDAIGGLIGANYGVIENSYSTVDVTGDNWGVGGLVGQNFGSISNSHATGTVNASSIGEAVGGLVGGNLGPISNSYSTVDVTGGVWGVGGLVGQNKDTISNSHATGTIVTTEAGQAVGGLVGYNEQGTISNSYSTVDITGGNWGIGGLVGENDDTILNSYAMGNVSGTDDAVGGLVGANYGVIENSYSTGLVTAMGDDIGGLVGEQWTSYDIVNSYYNSNTSGQSDNDERGYPRTTTEMTYPYDNSINDTYLNWDFDNIWHHDTTRTTNNGYPYNYTITSSDTTPPIISGLSSTTTPTKSKTWQWSSNEDATYRYTIDQISDTNPSGDYSSVQIATQSSGNGTYYIHVQAKDNAGNESEVTHVSALLDNTEPEITILGSNPASIYKEDSYIDAGATAYDNIDGNLTSSIVVTNDLDINTIGTYTYTYVVSDTARNTSTSTRQVNVLTRPSIGGGMTILPPTIDNNVENDTNNDSNTNKIIQISGTNSWITGFFVKTNSMSTVYFVDGDGIRHIYPSESIWKSYFGKDFSFVKIITNKELSGYPLGNNVVFKKGTLFKIPSVPKVYLASDGGLVHWIKTEAKATELYGNKWNKLIYDLNEAFFDDYLEENATE